MKKLAIFLNLVVFTMFGSSALAQVKIGFVGPLTGPVAFAGISQKNGIEMAVEDTNSKGGVKGVGKVEVIFEDTKCTPDATVAAVKRLLTRDKVVAIIGETCSPATLAIVKVMDEARIPLVTCKSSAPPITAQGSRYIFRTQLTSARTAAGLAEFSVKELKLRKIGILNDSDDFGMGGATSFNSEMERLGMKPVAWEKFMKKDKDFSAQLIKLKESGAEGVFIVGLYEEVALILKQAKQLGIKFQALGLDTITVPKFIELAGDAGEGIIASTAFNPYDPEPKVQEFVKRYTAKFNRQVDDSAAQGYDAMAMILHAMEKAGSADPEKLRDWIAKSDYKGVTGNTHFNEKGDDMRPFVKAQVKNGKYVFLAK